MSFCLVTMFACSRNMQNQIFKCSNWFCQQLNWQLKCRPNLNFGTNSCINFSSPFLTVWVWCCCQHWHPKSWICQQPKCRRNTFSVCEICGAVAWILQCCHMWLAAVPRGEGIGHQGALSCCKQAFPKRKPAQLTLKKKVQKVPTSSWCWESPSKKVWVLRNSQSVSTAWQHASRFLSCWLSKTEWDFLAQTFFALRKNFCDWESRLQRHFKSQPAHFSFQSDQALTWFHREVLENSQLSPDVGAFDKATHVTWLLFNGGPFWVAWSSQNDPVVPTESWHRYVVLTFLKIRFRALVNIQKWRLPL